MEGAVAAADATAAAAAAPTGRRPVVLYPSPGMGHLVSMIELGKILGSRGLPVTIVVVDPPYNAGATGPFLSGVSAANPSISFHRLPPPPTTTTSAADHLLPPVVRTKHHEGLTFDAIRAYNPRLREFLLAAASPSPARPAALVVDFFCSAALAVARDLAIPGYFFFTSGAEVLAFFLYLPVLHDRSAKDFKDMGQELVRVPGIPPFRATHAILPLMERDDAAYEGFLSASAELSRCHGVIVNTFRALEPRAVKAVSAGLCTPPGLPTPPVACIGPLIKSKEVVVGEGGVECLAWLDAQPEGSVVFLCFGSIGRFSAEQIAEVAAGLEASGQRFLWVVRAPPGGGGGGGGDDPARKLVGKAEEPDLGALLPEGFMARTEGRGRVVKSWAPQRDVLAHPAVGGFVTHCGWNSVLEAVMAGVPMVAWPLYAEQRLNRVFLTEEMRLAVAVEGYDGERELVAAEEVAAKVRWLMESDGGRALRDRTLAAMRLAHDALREGGESEAALARLVDEWRQA